MSRLQSFRENAPRFASLIDPSNELACFSDPDLADLIECLDYSRLSTTPRRKSQGGGERSLISNLPSPFFDDFLSLLPLGNSRSLAPTAIDFNDFNINTPPQSDHNSMARPTVTVGASISTSNPSNSFIHTHDSDNNNGVAHLSPTSPTTHTHIQNSQPQYDNQMHHQMSSSSQQQHQFSPSAVRAEPTISPSVIIGPPTIESSQIASQVVEQPYRKMSHGGKRPWYEQQQHQDLLNGDQMSVMSGAIAM